MFRVVKKVLRFPQVFLKWAKSAGWRVAWTCVVYRMKRALGSQQPPIMTLKPRRAKHPLMVVSGAPLMRWIRHTLPEPSPLFLQGGYRRSRLPCGPTHRDTVANDCASDVSPGQKSTVLVKPVMMFPLITSPPVWGVVGLVR